MRAARFEDHRRGQPALLPEPVVRSPGQLGNGVHGEERRRDPAQGGLLGHRLGPVLAELGVPPVRRSGLGPGAARTVEPADLVELEQGTRGPRHSHLGHPGRQAVHDAGQPGGRTLRPAYRQIPVIRVLAGGGGGHAVETSAGWTRVCLMEGGDHDDRSGAGGRAAGRPGGHRRPARQGRPGVAGVRGRADRRDPGPAPVDPPGPGPGPDRLGHRRRGVRRDDRGGRGRPPAHAGRRQRFPARGVPAGPGPDRGPGRARLVSPRRGTRLG